VEGESSMCSRRGKHGISSGSPGKDAIGHPLIGQTRNRSAERTHKNQDSRRKESPTSMIVEKVITHLPFEKDDRVVRKGTEVADRGLIQFVPFGWDERPGSSLA